MRNLNKGSRNHLTKDPKRLEAIKDKRMLLHKSIRQMSELTGYAERTIREYEQWNDYSKGSLDYQQKLQKLVDDLGWFNLMMRHITIWFIKTNFKLTS